MPFPRPLGPGAVSGGVVTSFSRPLFELANCPVGASYVATYVVLAGLPPGNKPRFRRQRHRAQQGADVAIPLIRMRRRLQSPKPPPAR
jgi:hypothetical protein